MKGIKLFMFVLFALLLACWAPQLFAADMLPAHDPTAFTIPGLPAAATPGNLLLWMIVTIGGFLYTVITEMLPFIRSCKFNGIADFFVQAFKALVVNPTSDTMRSELDALKQTVSAINAQRVFGGVQTDAFISKLGTLAAASESVLQAQTAGATTNLATAAVDTQAPAAALVPAPAAAALVAVDQSAQSAVNTQVQGGFASIKLLAFIALAALAFCFTGCAAIQSALSTDTTQSLSAKTLLSARQAVIGTAETLSTLCQQGKISMTTCVDIQQKYLQAQVAYNTASDLETAAFTAGAAPDTLTQYQAAESQLLTLFQDFQTVGKQFNVNTISP